MIKLIFRKIKQFFCRHKDKYIHIEYHYGIPGIVFMPVRGKVLEAITISCKKCGKRRGYYKLFHEYCGSGVQNEDYNLYKVDFKGTRQVEKIHGKHILTMLLRRKFITADSMRAILKAEKRT